MAFHLAPAIKQKRFKSLNARLFFMLLLSSADLWNTFRVLNCLDPVQDRHFVQTVCKGYQQMTNVATNKE